MQLSLFISLEALLYEYMKVKNQRADDISFS